MPAQESTFEIPPFPAFPSVSRYVALGSLEDARQRISRSIDARESLSLVVGPPGTGKSLLCAVLNREFSQSHDVVNIGGAPIQDAATFYRHLLHHLNVSPDAIPEGDLQLALINRVRDQEATEKGLLLLVDEAQAISAEVLEAIRMTTNIMLDEQPRVYAVVCGGPKLDETLALPAMEPMTQRVAARCYLHPLNSQETREYIFESIRHCGASPEETISDEAIAAVHHACSGVPRLINQLVTASIDVAADADQNTITDAIVDRAWAELQQLPSPMIEEPSLTSNSTSVEFGELDEIGSHSDSDPNASETLEFGELDGSSSFDFSNEPVAVDPSADTICETVCETEGSCCSASGESRCTIEEDKLTLRETESLEATPQTTPQTAPETVLFGQFEDEEEVELGSGIASAIDTITHPPVELESMLHSEIIGIANDASDASRFAGPISPASQPTTSYTEQNSVQWMEEVECTESSVDDSDIVIHDDSDMLVIEDDVDIRSVDISSRIDTEEQVVSVDFQAMLSKMRHGSSKEAS